MLLTVDTIEIKVNRRMPMKSRQRERGMRYVAASIWRASACEQILLKGCRVVIARA